MKDIKKILLNTGLSDNSNISLGVLAELIILEKYSILNSFRKQLLTDDIKKEIKSKYNNLLSKGFREENVFKLYQVVQKLETEKKKREGKISLNILKEVKKLTPNDSNIDFDIKSVSEKNIFTIERVLNLPILKDSDFKINTAKDFHLNNRYEGKTANISYDRINGALNKALLKKFNFNLNNLELKETHSLVKQEKKKGKNI